ncbi:MAG: AI-2E family transporter, partial [Myxococcota bacterium]
LFLFVPLFLLAILVTGQALEISESAQPWVAEQLARRSDPDAISTLALPEILQPYEPRIIEKAGQLAGSLGGFLVGALANATRGTVTFIFLSFVTLYATFFFLRDGRALLERLLRVMPLSQEHEERMVAQFLSVSRATVKGTLVIGIVQGGLAGGAFAIAGIEGAAFWGVVMAVLSIIPGLGTAIIWVPAVIFLGTTGQTVAAIALAVWCVAVVGTADNVLRPTLVGRDTQMPDLLILLSTLGGLMLFGAVGIIVGPLVAALFMTVWDIYLETFDAYLPPVASAAD